MSCGSWERLLSTSEMLTAAQELRSFREDLARMSGKLKKLRDYCELAPPGRQTTSQVVYTPGSKGGIERYRVEAEYS